MTSARRHVTSVAAEKGPDDRAVFLGLPVFSHAELGAHNTEGDLWMSAHGRVYDVSRLFESGAHPGGGKSLLSHAGQDCTLDFNFHSVAGQRDWAQYQIGWLANADRCSPLLGVAIWAFGRRRRASAAA
ncbi:hypothetical protein KFE25_007005 [Diacronema lutheri]|uniref:Cytochrome b5 heme-binding domain-containing protein n=2 Tax=Diacronema lutheri TaxID=2081491 RepID=A0A8J5XMU3_DIALT|nr:hypothetical protein KFE25_007005 [Diacronema lutheri]